MASIVNIPFNYQPVSSFISGSYTVAAGLYAYAVPMSLLCTLNGTDFQTNAYTSGTLTAATNYLIAGPGFTGRITSTPTSTNKQLSYGASSIVVTATGSTRIDVFVKNGTVINIASGTAASPAAGDFSTGLHYQHVGGGGTVSVTEINPQPCWVKEGDVLAGGQWLVTTYNQVT